MNSEKEILIKKTVFSFNNFYFIAFSIFSTFMFSNSFQISSMIQKILSIKSGSILNKKQLIMLNDANDVLTKQYA